MESGIHAPGMYDIMFYVCRQQRVARERRLHCLSELTRTSPRRTALWHPSPAAQRWWCGCWWLLVSVLPAGRCLHSAEAISSDPTKLWMSVWGRLPGSLYEPECSTGRNFWETWSRVYFLFPLLSLTYLSQTSVSHVWVISSPWLVLEPLIREKKATR